MKENMSSFSGTIFNYKYLSLSHQSHVDIKITRYLVEFMCITFQTIDICQHLLYFLYHHPQEERRHCKTRTSLMYQYMHSV